MVTGTSSRLQYGLSLAIVFAMCAFARTTRAHEITIHARIMAAALDYLTQKRPELIACKAPDIKFQLVRGAEDEDNEFSDLAPAGRFLFHFLPALNDRVLTSFQDPNPLFGGRMLTGTLNVGTSCDSLQWANPELRSGGAGARCLASTDAFLPVPYTSLGNSLGDRQVTAANTPDNTKTPQAIREGLAGLPGSFEKYSGLYALGHYAHLLQDLTSPPHTHNDAHPEGKDILWTRIDIDPSTFEALNKGRPILPQHYPTRDLIQFDDDEENPDAIADDRDAFRKLQAMVSSTYHSEKSAAQDTSLAQLRRVGSYAIDAFGRKVAKREFVTGLFTIDPAIAFEQFDELIPQAILYTASLLAHAHTEWGPLCEQELRVEIVGAGLVNSAGSPNRPPIQCGSAFGITGGRCQTFVPSGGFDGLISLAEKDWRFVRWEGPCVSSTQTAPHSGACNLARFTGAAPVVVRAVFEPN